MAGPEQSLPVRSLRMFGFSLALFLVGGMVFAMSFLIFATGNAEAAALPGSLGLLIMLIASLLLSTS